MYKGLDDSAEIVHNVALFAMGQFAECLQPKISKFSKELIPLLFQNIAKAQANIDKNADGLCSYSNNKIHCVGVCIDGLARHAAKSMSFFPKRIAISHRIDPCVLTAVPQS